MAEKSGLGKSAILGLQIVSPLTDQFKGTLELQNRGRTEFKIIFAESN
jgi:two-component sensor histidine kinase